MTLSLYVYVFYTKRVIKKFILFVQIQFRRTLRHLFSLTFASSEHMNKLWKKKTLGMATSPKRPADLRTNAFGLHAKWERRASAATLLLATFHPFPLFWDVTRYVTPPEVEPALPLRITTRERIHGRCRKFRLPGLARHKKT